MMRQVAYIAIQRFPFVLWVVFDSCQFGFCSRIILEKRVEKGEGMLACTYSITMPSGSPPGEFLLSIKRRLWEMVPDSRWKL